MCYNGAFSRFLSLLGRAGILGSANQAPNHVLSQCDRSTARGQGSQSSCGGSSCRDIHMAVDQYRDAPWRYLVIYRQKRNSQLTSTLDWFWHIRSSHKRDIEMAGLPSLLLREEEFETHYHPRSLTYEI